MGCRKLTYYQIPELPELKAVRPKNKLTLKNSSEKAHREQLDAWSGSGNHYTTLHRPYNPRTGRWDKADPLKADFPWQSPYVGMDNNPTWNTDIYGDSTKFFNSAGEQIFQSNDGLENAIVSIEDDQLASFQNRLVFAQTIDGFNPDDDNFVDGLRDLGIGYAIDDFKAFFNENRRDIGENRLANEHKTFLYLRDGLVRPGSENIQGDAFNVVGGSPLRSGAKGKLHIHPNAGKSAGFGRTFTHKPSSNDVTGWKFSRSPLHFDVVVSDKYIYFINNNQSENLAVPFRNTFGGGNSVETFDPWGE